MKTTKIFLGVVLFAFLFVPALVAPAPALAAECDIQRNLDLGDQGEDVMCLQKYLNSAGFVIALSGVGSPGNETGLLRELTRQAISNWQSANGIQPTGYFGPLSRQKLASLPAPTSGASAGQTGTTASGSGHGSAVQALQDQLALALSKIDAIKNSGSTGSTVSTGDRAEAERAINVAIDAIEDADDQLDDAEQDGGDEESASDALDDARDDLFKAVKSYFEGDMAQAVVYAEAAEDNAIDALEEAGGESEEDEAEEFVEEIQDRIDEAWDTINDADNNGEDVEEAEDLMGEAEDKLDEAEELLDDEDFEGAFDLAEEAEELVDEALDSIEEGQEEEADAEDAINDAWDALDDARDEVAEADDDGADVDEAEDLLDEAEDILDEADEAFDDEDFDEAIDLANEAEDLIDEALDTL